jgi:hypothetical protein
MACIYDHRRCCERTTGLGGTQPSCFTLISSSGPVLTPIQCESAGCDKNRVILITEMVINQSAIMIFEKIAIKILIDGVTPGKSPSVIRRSGDNDLNRQFPR